MNLIYLDSHVRLISILAMFAAKILIIPLALMVQMTFCWVYEDFGSKKSLELPLIFGSLSLMLHKGSCFVRLDYCISTSIEGCQLGSICLRYFTW